MAHVSVVPDVLTAAAADVEKIRADLVVAHLASAPSTVAVMPAAADEVSASIAHLFSEHAQDYRAVAGQAAAYQQQFVENLRTGAYSYAGAESVNDLLLSGLLAVRYIPPVAMLFAAVAYASWITSWIDFIPGFLQVFALVPAGLLVAGAFAYAVLATFIAAGIGAVFGIA